MKLTRSLKSSRFIPRIFGRLASAGHSALPGIAALCALALGDTSARASIAYGSINNFDTVNDTGTETHGFEIEIDDIHSRDITYTYDYNHYGIPRITEDNTDPLHPRVFVRYAATFANGAWSAYTAIPAAPIAPTMGHQFTNPAVNFGGEHFGVGYTAAPSAVKYNWLLDDGSQGLIHGPAVDVSTPTFVYVPPLNAAPAKVVAAIVPPPPPVPPPLQFGKATWVKEIKTKTHSANKIALVDLVGEDPGKPQPWANGVDAGDAAQIEVEVEWRVLQTDFRNAANAKGVLQGAAEPLPHGNEVITRRYEFYKYTGPLDYESGEAVADTVAKDGKHGSIKVTYNSGFDPATGELIETTVDTATLEIVGDFFGTQMSAFDVDAKLDLIDHLQDGDLNQPYVERKVVVAGSTAFQASTSGVLPQGMTLDPVTGVLSGTPTQGGLFTFDVSATDLKNVTVKKTYSMAIASDGVAPVLSLITTTAVPDIGGGTAGSGSYFSGTNVSVVATTNAGYDFVNWTENGVEVSASSSYSFTAAGDRALTANFAVVVPNFTIGTSASPANFGTTSGGGSFAGGASVTVTATPNAGASFVSWSEGGAVVSNSAGYSFTASADRALVANFTLVVANFTIGTSASPANLGTAGGGGSFASGASVTVTATPGSAGASFVSWSEGGNIVSNSASYTFTASANRVLVANFQTAALPLTSATFKGIVADLAAPMPERTGLLCVTTNAVKGGFTAKLQLGAENYSFKGVFNSEGHALANVPARHGHSTLAVDLQISVGSGIVGTVSDGTNVSAFTARPCPYSKVNPLAVWPGSYTHIIGFPRHLLPPLPVGTGTQTITASGSVRIAGKLSDGTSYTCSGSVTDAGSFPLYSPAKRPGFAGFIVSDVLLDAAKIGSLTEGSPLTWKPASPQAFGQFQFFMDRYTPPARGKTALQVNAGVPNLDILATNPIGAMLASWKMMLRNNPSATDQKTGPGPITLSVTAASGTIAGKLNDGTARRSFTGVLWQSANSGFAILPGFGDEASLTIVATSTAP